MTPLQKLPKNVGDLGKLIVAKVIKSCPKSNNLPNLVTLKGSIEKERRKRLKSASSANKRSLKRLWESLVRTKTS